MADLYIMAGCPGSGKSTFLKNKINKDDSVIVSRDEIRFSILKPYEQYFTHEKEVLEIFWTKINEALAANKTVFADQTSLTTKSRKWLLNHVSGYDHVNLIWIDEDLDTCLERNEMRRGTKAYVPRDTVCRMYSQFTIPSLDEGFYRIYRYNSKENRMTYKGVEF
jgi:predicted kinase